MSRPPRPVWQRDLAVDAVAVAVILLLAGAAYVVLPAGLALLTRIAALMLLVLAIDLVTGFAGVATLGHAALFGAGAYGAGIAAVHFGITDPLAMLAIGAAAGGLAGMLASLFILRGHGLGQLVLSIAVVQLAYEAANRFSRWTGGSDGLSGIRPDPLLGIWRFDLWGRTSYWLAVVLVIAVFLLLRRVARSPFGLLLRAIRQDPLRVRAMGAPVFGTLVRVYALSGTVAGLGGALAALSTRVVGLDSLSFELSAEGVVMLVLGGAGTLFGAMIGTAIFVTFEHLLATINPFHWQIIVGVLLVVLVLFAPRGLCGAALGLWRRLRRGA